jgi:hypothetical protein
VKNAANTPVDNPAAAFLNFQQGLSRALRVTKEDLAQRVERDNAERDADRIEHFQLKRGPKPKK